ncbi:hypothetical protein ZEAMMB73_Zm00001d027791 [Zea mays]|uniref:Uncharacterized protein n=1 Tax=Zea mays TaxID=4577 RepID=A0A1D6JPN4_MAIZE|nr:hypothetical protein ZEAMMB73_Zm00001d027791 [Zea mays]
MVAMMHGLRRMFVAHNSKSWAHRDEQSTAFASTSTSVSPNIRAASTLHNSPIRENAVLKRGVAIQHERQKEFDVRTQEVDSLKEMVNCDTWFDADKHLKQAQQNNSMPVRVHTHMVLPRLRIHPRSHPALHPAGSPAALPQPAALLRSIPPSIHRQPRILASLTSSAGEGFDVTKSGDARVGLVGIPSVGKSTLLNKLTWTFSEVQIQLQLTIEAQGRYLQMIIEEQQKLGGSIKASEDQKLSDSPPSLDDYPEIMQPSPKKPRIDALSPDSERDTTQPEFESHLIGPWDHGIAFPLEEFKADPTMSKS